MKKLLLLTFLVLSSSVFADEDPAKETYLQRFCLQFEQSTKFEMGLTIRDMEASPYQIEDYFEHTECQTGAYSTAVQSPMLHLTLDDPSKHEDKLNTLWLYYSKKRKQPEIFTRIINVPNTRGETILDFIESLKNRGEFDEATLKPVTRIITMLCEHGGIYSTHSKSCPGNAVQKSWNQKFCGKLFQIGSNEMDTLIREMEDSPFPIDGYFNHSECTMKWTPGGGNASTSPMIHSVLEDVSRNESKLDSIIEYYTSLRKRPDLLTNAINLPNTPFKLTTLDYVEFLKLQNRFTNDELNGPVSRIISKLCANGGKYSNYNKSCPNL